jgi:serine/threonine protein kinase
VLWNTPEGYLSLLSEYCPGTTLLDMLKYTNTLPELFIAKMTTGIIKALKLV